MKWIHRFFVVLGVIFFFILIGVGYFIVADPFHIRPLVMSMYQMQSSQDDTDDTTKTIDSPATQFETTTATSSSLSDNQTNGLEAVGIAPESVPTQFSPEQVACFNRILGQERVNEIKGGDMPTPAEYYMAKECV